ncbi:3-oxoacyl-ACP synthase III family protein [Butyricimonas virosa]|uniref:3-oxoacyl-ACP synthase III family protein n=1 Tax=Butyricimonas virosa TaxID=544645 RepID=UPI0039F5548C
MALQEINNIEIVGIAAAVPKYVEYNLECEIIGSIEDREKFIETTGIVSRHIVGDSCIRTSDMCYEAAEKLISELRWIKEEIDCLIFVSQTGDYIFPATSCILQSKLGLSKECFTLDINLGCSGWIHGLTTISALMQNGCFKKGLLLVGDTSSLTKSKKDKSSYPLFGDAGTATALIYKVGASGIRVHTSTDGDGADSIIIPDGGFRNMTTIDSFREEEFENGICRTRLDTRLDGAAVFTFGITQAPRSVKKLREVFGNDIANVDYYILHQANKILTERVRKKIGADLEQTPYSLDEYGNTSCSSIPLTIVTRIQKEVMSRKCALLATAFGVGLSWGSVYFEINKIVCPSIILI